MITRTDLRMSGGSVSDCETSSTPYFGVVQETQMDHCEFQCVESSYPSSVYDLPSVTDTNDRNTFEDRKNSFLLSDIVSEMLTPSSTSSNNCFNQSEETENTNCCPVVVEDDMHHHTEDFNEDDLRSSVSPDHMSISLQDDLERFSYLQPNTPESLTKNSIPLSQIENIPNSPLNNDFKIEHEVTQKPACLERNNYDTSSLMYDNDDMTTFSGLVNCNEVLKTHKKIKLNEDHSSSTIVCCYRSNSSEEVVHKISEVIKVEQQEGDENFFSHVQETTIEESRKGKISGLQRRALDCIFSVTDRPSRGLVLHIAGELCLHHITVKNFFSNGRRRLRRAAARLNDPERTRRENQRRKEKRRLAAIAAAATMSNGERGNGSSLKASNGEGGSDLQGHRDPPVLSPERRALMEKLAVKVQRSVAQKGLAASLGEAMSSPPNLNNSAQYQNQVSLTFGSLLPTQLHSNSFTSTELIKPLMYQQVEDSVLTSSEENFGSIFSYSESEPMSSYNSSPDQNNMTFYTTTDQENPYSSVNQEGPYSPTSWQTLLHV